MEAQALSEAMAISAASETIFHMDVILPSQYFAEQGNVGFSSEQRLMLAVLVDAINVLEGWRRTGGVRERKAFAEAAQWVNVTGTSHPFSFDSVCEALEIDPGLMRSRLFNLTLGLAYTARHSTRRLRLKELSRGQRMSANRLRRRGTRELL
jgi:hypothetical protein